jgi:tetratricopeptide (TPR) repeat protein
VDLLLVTGDLLESGAYTRQYGQAACTLVSVAHARSNALVEGRARLLHGLQLRVSGQLVEAEDEARRALLLGNAAADAPVHGRGALLMSDIMLDLLRYEECTQWCDEALKAFRASGDQHGEASTLSRLSLAWVGLRDMDAALAASLRAVAIHRKLGTGHHLGKALDALSIPLVATGQIDEALARLTEALEIFREAGQHVWESRTLSRLAEVHLTAHRWQESATVAEQSLVVLRKLGDEQRTADALTLLGHALRGMGQLPRADAYWQEALDLYTALGASEALQVRRLLADTPASAAVSPGSGPG